MPFQINACMSGGHMTPPVDDDRASCFVVTEVVQLGHPLEARWKISAMLLNSK